MRWVFALLALVGCGQAATFGEPAPRRGGDGPGLLGDDGVTGTGTGASVGTGSGAVAGTGTGSGAGTGTGSATGTGTGGEAPRQVVRFVALGDAGEGNPDQYEVANAMEQVCARDGCDFAIYLGDNFYDSGVDDIDDTQFQTKFEEPYANIDFPFWITLGNHDLGLDGIGLEFWKASIYVKYTQHSTKWTMPHEFYAFEAEHVKFFSLNTTEVFFGVDTDQQAWLDAEIANTGKHIKWKIAFGHHPYISNGQHGNAGNYEGIPDLGAPSDIPRGRYIKEFIEESLCGQVTLYISGHDHNRQFLDDKCGTGFIVSGAGSKTTELVGRGNSTFFEDDTKEGFLWVEIIDNQFTGTFYDKYGVVDYTQTFVF